MVPNLFNYKIEMALTCWKIVLLKYYKTYVPFQWYPLAYMRI
jgi:hypothetical protein